MFNQLTAAEIERLAILAEEMGEAQQVIGKILRHGYQSSHPDTHIVNRELLARELGDVRYAMIALCDAGDVSKLAIHTYAEHKAERIKPFLHHQGDAA